MAPKSSRLRPGLQGCALMLIPCVRGRGATGDPGRTCSRNSSHRQLDAAVWPCRWWIQPFGHRCLSLPPPPTTTEGNPAYMLVNPTPNVACILMTP
uniref:Putative secreted protein n=1 Tax=Anopheles triannulatus TaxID=58253 RepID=A0A2M4B744_9DIPT